MFCEWCGKQNEDGSRFCIACGKPVTMAGSAVVLIFIYSMITWYLLDRKLNLE